MTTVGVIDHDDERAYGSPETYVLGQRWLARCSRIEDWGCGRGYFRTLLAPTQQYLGVDIGVDSVPGPNRFARIQTDLAHYRSRVPGLFMRHVLEHNLEWRAILTNALASFQDRLCLVIHTPFLPEDAPASPVALRWYGPPEYPCYETPVPNWSFKRSDIDAMLVPHWSIYERCPSGTEFGAEHVWCVERRDPAGR